MSDCCGKHFYEAEPSTYRYLRGGEYPLFLTDGATRIPRDSAFRWAKYADTLAIDQSGHLWSRGVYPGDGTVSLDAGEQGRWRKISSEVWLDVHVASTNINLSNKDIYYALKANGSIYCWGGPPAADGGMGLGYHSGDQGSIIYWQPRAMLSASIEKAHLIDDAMSAYNFSTIAESDWLSPSVGKHQGDDPGSGASFDISLHYGFTSAFRVNAGSGYSAPPVASVSNPGEVVEDVSLSCEMRYFVDSIHVAEQTSPYRGPVSVVFSPGNGGNSATAECTLDGSGFISSVVITHGGEYSSPPTARFVGTGGNAVAEVTPNGSVFSVTLRSSGRYTSRSVSLDLSPPDLEGGTQATLSATKGVAVDNIRVINGGSGYTSPTDFGLTLRVGNRVIARLSMTPSGVASIKNPTHSWQAQPERRTIPAMTPIASAIGVPQIYNALPQDVRSPRVWSYANGYPFDSYITNPSQNNIAPEYELRFSGNTRPPVALVSSGGYVMSPVDINDYESEPYVVAIVPETTRFFGLRSDVPSPSDYLASSASESFVAPVDLILRTPFWCGPGVAVEVNPWAHGCWEVSSDKLLGGDILTASPLDSGGRVRTKASNTYSGGFYLQGIFGPSYHNSAGQNNAPSGWHAYTWSGSTHALVKSWHDFRFKQTIPRQELSVPFLTSLASSRIKERRDFSAVLYGNESSVSSAAVLASLSSDGMTATVSLSESGSGYRAEPTIVVTQAILSPRLIGEGFTSMAGRTEAGIAAVKNGAVYACGAYYGGAYWNYNTRVYSSVLKPVGKALAFYDPDRQLPSEFGRGYWRDAGQGLGENPLPSDNDLIGNIVSQLLTDRDDVVGHLQSPLLNDNFPNHLEPFGETYGSVVIPNADGPPDDLPPYNVNRYLAINKFAYPRVEHELERGPPAGGRYDGSIQIPGGLSVSDTVVANAFLGLYETGSYRAQNPRGDYVLPPGYPVFVLRAPYFLSAPSTVPFGLTCQTIGPDVAVRVRPNVSGYGGYLVEDSNGKTWSLFSLLQGHSSLLPSAPLRDVTIVTTDSTSRSWAVTPTSVRTTETEIRQSGTNNVCGIGYFSRMGFTVDASFAKTLSTQAAPTPYATSMFLYLPHTSFFSLRQESVNNTVSHQQPLAKTVQEPFIPLTPPITFPSGATFVDGSGPYTQEAFGGLFPSQSCPTSAVGGWFFDSFVQQAPSTGVSFRAVCELLRTCQYSQFSIPVSGSHSHVASIQRIVGESVYPEAPFAGTARVGKYGTLELYPASYWTPGRTPDLLSVASVLPPESPPVVRITTPTGAVYEAIPYFLTSPLVGPLNNLRYSSDIARHDGFLSFDSQGKFLSRYGQPVNTLAEADTSKYGVAAGVTKAGSVWVATAHGPITASAVDLSVSNQGRNYDLIPYYDFYPPTGGRIAKAESQFDGKVIAVAIESEGRGFTSPPNVVFSGGGGSGAEAEAVIEGGVTSLVISDAGEGYSIAPKLRFSGAGIPASARCSVDAGGHISSVSIDSPGLYRSPPSVEIVPDKRIASISVTAGGEGYFSPPTVVICNTGRSGGAAASSRINGQVVSVTVISGGGDYSPDDPPTIVFEQQDGAAAASARAIIDSETGEIVSVEILSGGSFYQSVPAVQVQSQQGGGAILSALIAGPVAEVLLTQSGEGYESPPVILFQGGGGTGAAATASVESVGSGGSITASIDGRVKYIRVVHTGSLYDFPPDVTLTGGGNSAADAAAAEFAAGDITREEYESNAAVCVAKAIVEGNVTSVNVTSAGSGYVRESGIQDSQEFYVEAVTMKPPVFTISDGLANSDTLFLNAPTPPGGGVSVGTDTTSRKFRRKPRIYAPDDVVVSMDRETFSWTSGAAIVDSSPLPVTQSPAPHSGLQASRSRWGGELDRFTKACVVVVDGKSIHSATLRRGDSRTVASGVRVDLESMVRFSQPPTIALRDAAGSGAVVQASIDGQGFITGASFSSQGQGYTSACHLEITSASLLFEQCQATAVIAGDGSVSHVVVTNSGKGYIRPVAVAHDGRGGGCVLAAHLESGVGPRGISSIEVASGGAGFVGSEPPSIFVYDAEPDFISSDVCVQFNSHLKRNSRLSVNFTAATAEYIDRKSPHAWEVWKRSAAESLRTDISQSDFARVHDSTTRAVSTVRIRGIESLTARRAGTSVLLGGVASEYAGEEIQSVAESPLSGCRPHVAATYTVNGVTWREATAVRGMIAGVLQYNGLFAADRS